MKRNKLFFKMALLAWILALPTYFSVTWAASSSQPVTTPLLQHEQKLSLKEKLVLKKALKKSSIKIKDLKELKTTQEVNATKEGNDKNQVVAALLCWFIGTMGIHRFYLGYTGAGIAQLLTLGGCGIWAFVDFIRICVGDLKPKDGEYV